MRQALIVAAVSSGVTLAAGQRPPDKAFIDLAKNADVSALDKTLPKQRFEDWFKKTVGPQAKISWSTTDCGEGSGSPADATRDLPVCVEPMASYSDGRLVVMEMAVGSGRRGMSKEPSGFYAIAMLEDKGTKATHFNTLSQLAAALRK